MNNCTGIIDVVIEVFRRWLYLPDAGALLIVLATVVANLLTGDPVWLLLIGPPSSGKNELISAISRLPHNIHCVSTISSEGALLSGSSKAHREAGGNGGLLCEIGKFGFLLMKDFTSILSMHREKRAEVLAALRETYDGAWIRRIGVDGGRRLTWTGKLALIGGCTEAIDSAHSVMALMGERFLQYRLPPTDGRKQARCVLRQPRGKEAKMRAELAEMVNLFFEYVEIPKSAPRLSEGEEERLIALASLAVRCRSAVERHYYTREIESVPEAEAPARLARCLSQLLAGFKVIDVGPDEMWRLLTKAALDGMPTARRKAFDCLAKFVTGMDASGVARITEVPQTTIRRALEDLEALGIVNRSSLLMEDGKSREYWTLSAWAARQLDIANGGVPDMSDGEDD